LTGQSYMGASNKGHQYTQTMTQAFTCIQLTNAHIIKLKTEIKRALKWILNPETW